MNPLPPGAKTCLSPSGPEPGMQRVPTGRCQKGGIRHAWCLVLLGWRVRCFLELPGTPLPLCSLPAPQALGSWSLHRPSSRGCREPLASHDLSFWFLFFFFLFQIKFQKCRFKNSQEMQSSPPSRLAKTNPQQRPVCSVASHLLIFRRQLSSVLGGEGKGRQDSGSGGGWRWWRLRVRAEQPGTGWWVGRQGRTPSGRHTPLQEDSCFETAVKSHFPWNPSSLVPSPGLGSRSKQPWKTVSANDPEFTRLPWGDISLCSSAPFPIRTYRAAGRDWEQPSRSCSTTTPTPSSFLRALFFDLSSFLMPILWVRKMCDGREETRAQRRPGKLQFHISSSF